MHGNVLIRAEIEGAKLVGFHRAGEDCGRPKLDGHRLIGVFRQKGDMPLLGALHGPLQNEDQLLDAEEANHHSEQNSRATLDQRPAQVFEMFEKGFYSATFNLLVGWLRVIARFCHA